MILLWPDLAVEVGLNRVEVEEQTRRAAVHDHAHATATATATAVGMVGWIEPTNRP